MFDYSEERSDSPALSLTYHVTPWDEAAFQISTAAISAIEVRAEREGPDAAFEKFREWCAQNRIRLVSCRLPQDRLIECGFLEKRGFRFIELNYRPTRTGLEEFADDPEIDIREADADEVAEISRIASRIFASGRLGLDPQVGAKFNNLRYAAWVANAVQNPAQRILTFRLKGRTVAFMIVEAPAPESRFWSLVGVAPDLQGQGLGRRAWRAALAFHRREGVREVSTSISSHNVAVLNLYVSLGFRFPAPNVTLHWCPFGPLNAASQG